MISGYLVGDKEMVRTLRVMPARAKADIDQQVQRLGLMLQARVQRDYLRGPRPTRLGVRTSRLIASIAGGADTRTRFVSTKNDSFFYVGTNVPYGAMWERGFVRKIGAGARGGPRTLIGRARESYFAKHPSGSKSIGARPFLHPALEDMRPQIVQGLGQALQKSMLDTIKGR